MKIKEYMSLSGLSHKQIMDRIKKGRLPAVKQGKEWSIFQGSDKTSGISMGEPVDEPERVRGGVGSKLKDMLTTVQIRKIQQQLREKQKDIEERFKIDLLEKMYEALKPIPDAYRKCKLTKEQAKLIQAAYDESMRRLGII